jgi:hypothetical protein
MSLVFIGLLLFVKKQLLGIDRYEIQHKNRKCSDWCMIDGICNYPYQAQYGDARLGANWIYDLHNSI